MKRIHLIGIGGSGLSAIATVLLERGYAVSGSDRQPSPQTQRLEQAGARLFFGHSAENVAGADVVVRSSAVHDDNPEVQAALAAGIPVLKRSEFLKQLFAGQAPLAVAGSHGKTTTTAMLAWTLHALGVDPSYVIGGVAANLGANAHAGSGRYFVIEADEYDRMFLGIRPLVAVVTNIEHDHPDCYPTAEDFYQAFRAFAGNLQTGGVLIACGDDSVVARRLLPDALAAGIAHVLYGIGPANFRYTAADLSVNPSGSFGFEAYAGSQRLAHVELQVPGEHNVRNALAVLAVVDWLGLPVKDAAAALAEFRGAGRRFELIGEPGGVTLIDDYAHHPTEIRATLSAARQRYPGRRIWAAWQPHTYSRARLLQAEFAQAFDDADHVLVTDIYAAREEPPADGFSGRNLWEAIMKYRLLHSTQHNSAELPISEISTELEEDPFLDREATESVAYVQSLKAAGDYLLDHLRKDDVLLVLSAGDADRINARLERELAARSADTAGRRESHV